MKGRSRFALTKAYVHLAQAAMANRDASVSDLAREIGVKPTTLHRYVGRTDELRGNGARPQRHGRAIGPTSPLAR